MLQNLYNWLTGKKQTLNINISKFVIFHPYQTQLAYQSKLCMFDNEKNKYARLQSKVEPKYLGVLLDRNLSRRYYIDSVFTKINKNFGLIEKLRRPAPRPILVLIFRPNWLPKGRRKFFLRLSPPPFFLRVWMTGAPHYPTVWIGHWLYLTYGLSLLPGVGHARLILIKF